jgi:hypothetical protein
VCAIVVGSVVRPVAAVTPDDRQIRIIALHRQADGAGLVATVSYICDSAREYNWITIRVAQSLAGRRIASAQESRYNVPCTGERTTARFDLMMSRHAARNGVALVSASYRACDERDCYDRSYDQRLLAVDSAEVSGHRLSTEQGTLVVAEPAQLLAGGAGAFVTLRLRCASAASLNFDVGVTQRLAGGDLAQGFLNTTVPCGTTWRSRRVIVAAHDRGLIEGDAFVTLRAQFGSHYVDLFRTVSIGTDPLEATTLGGVTASARPAVSDGVAPPRVTGQNPTPSATTGAARVAVKGATRHARGAGVVVRVRARCAGADLNYLTVEVTQTLPDGGVSYNGAAVLMNNCDGQYHTTRVGVLAADGVPYGRGPALVRATLGEASVATPVSIAADQGSIGTSQGSYDFAVKPTGRVVAGGAGLRIGVTGQCGGLFAVLHVAQRDGDRVITGSEERLVACSSVGQKTRHMAAFADDVALTRRPTFVSLELGYFDDYQSFGESGYAYRTIAVD